MNKRAAIYARVSTEEQGSNYSLPTQLEGCRQYAEKLGCTVVEEF
jgi:DNA invertase Pin-like site-specific DNA recombinase